MLRLIGTDGTRLFAFDLKPGSHQIGRDPAVTYHIPDQTVSRVHAILENDPSNGRIHLEDAGSHNGTLVNGVRITARTPVKAGDQLQFGRAQFRLRDEAISERPRSQPTAAVLSDADPEKSVVIPISEALKPLPSKVTDLPDLFPTLSEMARSLVLSEPREDMLQRALKLINRIIPAERLAVLMTDNEGDNIYAASTLLPQGRDPGSFTLSKTIVHEILSQQSAVLIGDPKADPRFAAQQSIIMSALRSAMAVPIFDEQRVLGILYVDTTNPIHRYNDDYLRLLATFGNIIASRLQNYTLIQERQERQVYEAELKRASAIQQTLLARTLPEFPSYRVRTYQQQCRAVGGDLFDVALLPSGRLVVIVADVSGKGMGAALLMSNILASFRILYNVSEFTLGEVVSMVSSQLHKCSGPADFATLFVGVIDPHNHEMKYINAGHNPPLMLRHDGTQENLEAGGIMIGAFDPYAWTEQSVTMHPEDMLLIFTDGVTEAQRDDGTQYSEARLTDLASKAREMEPEKFLECIMEDIERFLEDAPRSDDITMLAVKRIS